MHLIHLLHYQDLKCSDKKLVKPMVKIAFVFNYNLKIASNLHFSKLLIVYTVNLS